MRWDFEDDNVPVPGGELTAYLRIQPDGPGSHVEVHQLVETPAQAAFMEGAWAMVLGRLKAGVTRACDHAEPMPPPTPPQAHPRLTPQAPRRLSPQAPRPAAKFMIAGSFGRNAGRFWPRS